MVMYRDFAKRNARRLGLVGYVKNLDDGSVEVVAQGSRENLEKLIEQLHKGSMFARVARVDVEWKQQAEKKFDSFTIVL